MLRLKLTPTQEAIYHGIVRGYTNKRIGVEAGICEKTVKAHVTKILKKTLYRTRCELIVAHYTLGQQKEQPQC